MRFGGRRFLAVCVGLASSFFLSGCQVLDMATYEPRTYEVNLGTQNLREELILLNVVRASRFEPLNFTALSKYTASGSLGAGASASKNIGIDFALFRGGSATGANVGASPLNTIGATGSTTTGNSFDLSPLDNSDFYQNFLATLTPQNVNLLVNAGLSREVVFYSVVKAIDVNLTAKGQARAKYTRLRFSNLPSNNAWHFDGAIEADTSWAAFEKCEGEAATDFGRHQGAPFYGEFWLGKHLSDCSFSKFKMLIGAALKYGVTTHAQARAQNTQQQQTLSLKVDGKTNVIMLPSASGSGASSGSKGGLGSGSSDQSQDVILCFDPTIAAQHGIPMKSPSVCPEGSGKKQKNQKTHQSNETLLTQPLTTHLGDYDESMEPILPSAYGVFQFYGQLLKMQALHPQAPLVQISGLAARKTGEIELFHATNDQTSCFVHVNYAGSSYCVPNDDANNTKEVLTLLIALVNLSTTRNTLPYTSSVITNP